jgi:hypothetical protein
VRRRFLARLAIVPFEEMIAEFVLLSGILGALGIVPPGPLDVAVGNWAHVFYGLYALSGLAMLVGIGLERANIEGAGVALLMSNALVRMVASVALFGFTTSSWVSIVFYLVIARACSRRLVTLVRGETVLKVGPDTEVIE